MVFVTGDTHSSNDSDKFNSFGEDLTKDDYVIVCGDFGYLWDSSEKEMELRKWLSDKPWTTLFVDGNHENFDLLEELEEVEMFGSVVGKVTDSIYHLKRGQIYNIEGKNLFTFGGGLSIDKEWRYHYERNNGVKIWWEQEMPTRTQKALGIANTCAYAIMNKPIHFILTHTCPAHILPQVVQNNKGITDAENYLEEIHRILNEEVTGEKYSHWYFGHFHDNIDVDNRHTLLYDEIRRII